MQNQLRRKNTRFKKNTELESKNFFRNDKNQKSIAIFKS